MALSGYGKFQQEYEEHASRELAALVAKPTAELLDVVRAGKFGDSYQLWYAIAEKATLQQAGWVLFDVLKSKADYLHRYHCAAALIKIAGKPLAAMTAVGLSAEKAQPVAQNWVTVENFLVATIGTRTP
ncbi:hypothetical protein BH10PLA1_BH10PLA1_20780 [soil metagenome]